MERILLVEPNYKNKYPPIGLMKISSYFKSRNDFVEFRKGLMPKKQVESFDKVFITTLFTFDFDICIDTIRYYVEILGLKNVYVGGIASSIMPENFEKKIPGIQILKGQLTSSEMLGYNDDINIDIMPLDYDILWDIDYEYPAADSYFVYTSRGCPRKCSFCAVKTLEPVFYECKNIKRQIEQVDEQFGPKKQLLIMDNNALNSENLEQNINILVELGFGINNNTIKKNSCMKYYLQSLFKRLEDVKQYTYLLERIKKEFREIKKTRISNYDRKYIENIQGMISNEDDLTFISFLKENQSYIVEFYEKYHYHKVKRYVDFNQGLDARLFTVERAELLSRIALKPCRIAFDDIKTKEEYFEAMNMALEAGIYHFSNYLLYNFKDKPADLWNRLYLNVDFCEKNPQVKSLFSFPMKYASIEHTDRSYVGKYWNKKFLRSINIILNVTSGVVAREKDFFIRAYGENEEEFVSILTMPSDFIRYRDYFEKNGLIDKWKLTYSELSDEYKAKLINMLSESTNEHDLFYEKHDVGLDYILRYYCIQKKTFERNEAYHLKTLGLYEC